MPTKREDGRAQPPKRVAGPAMGAIGMDMEIRCVISPDRSDERTPASNAATAVRAGCTSPYTGGLQRGGRIT